MDNKSLPWMFNSFLEAGILLGEKKGCKSPDIPSYVAQVYSKEVVHNLYISETEKIYVNQKITGFLSVCVSDNKLIWFSFTVKLFFIDF